MKSWLSGWSCVICGRWGCEVHVGYRGQRYEVRAKSLETGEDVKIGWTNYADGSSLASAARLNHGWTDIRVVDLHRKPDDES